MSENDDRRAAFEAALASEYFGLQGVRGSTISEASARASLYFPTLTGTLLALGFLAGTTDAVAPVAYAAMPIVILLGLLSVLRLVDLGIEDVLALQAIQRIRRYYAQLHPEAPPFFPLPKPGQEVNTLLYTGVERAPSRAALTTAATVGTVNSLVFGAAVAFALADFGVHDAISVILGLVAAVAVGWQLARYQNNRFALAIALEQQEQP